MTTGRKVADCRRFPSAEPCTLTIAGTEDEVMDALMQHIVSCHGGADTPEFREQVRPLLADE